MPRAFLGPRHFAFVLDGCDDAWSERPFADLHVE